MNCPKCQAPMRQYERNGITIDQCTQCRGVYLDRGELDQLLDAESSQFQNAGAYPQPRHDDDDYNRNQYGHKKKRRGGFLSEFFDD